MKNKTIYSRFLFFMLIFCLKIPFAAAEESILSFHSDIMVNEDSSLTVTETIKARVEGNKIKRGIYRDFPTKYKDKRGNSYIVGFQIIEVRKNGVPEPYRVESLSNGKRVYIGESRTFLKPGEYIYTLAYRTDHQLGYFKDFDELYWNVTGNRWEFRIDKASAEIHLPGDAGKKIISSSGYTGPQGSQGKDFTENRNPSGIIRFAMTRPLNAEEGLTIALSWPKGYVRQPEEKAIIGHAERTEERDNFYGLLGLLILIAYYGLVWLMAGKDPEKGIIVVRYAPPNDMSPSVMRFISKMNFDNKSFVAAIINIAVKGHATISYDDGEYLIRKKDGGKIPLTVEERKVYENLFGAARELRVIKRNHAYISGAIKVLTADLKLRFEKIYFVTNRKYFVLGLLLTAMLLFLSGFSVAQSKMMIAPFVFMCVWLTVWSAGVIALVRQVIANWKLVFSRGGRRLAHFASAIFLTLFSLPFIGGEIIGMVMMAKFTSFIMVIFLLIAMGINYLFFHLLKAPTRAGRAVLDSIEGFRRFLVATEKDRLNMMNPPERTPELFEKYLAYAISLDVEHEWGDQFASVLESAALAGESGGYRPVWYHGTIWNAGAPGDFAESIGTDFGAAVSSSSSAPGSSSGSGGGGSSGGGGGGGGGGGW